MAKPNIFEEDMPWSSTFQQEICLWQKILLQQKAKTTRHLGNPEKDMPVARGFERTPPAKKIYFVVKIIWKFIF